jgi:hypothetical protein
MAEILIQFLTFHFPQPCYYAVKVKLKGKEKNKTLKNLKNLEMMETSRSKYVKVVEKRQVKSSDVSVKKKR